MDREHEHGARRQQDAVSRQQRTHQVHPLHTHAVRGAGSGRRLSSDRQSVSTKVGVDLIKLMISSIKSLI